MWSSGCVSHCRPGARVEAEAATATTSPIAFHVKNEAAPLALNTNHGVRNANSGRCPPCRYPEDASEPPDPGIRRVPTLLMAVDGPRRHWLIDDAAGASDQRDARR